MALFDAPAAELDFYAKLPTFDHFISVASESFYVAAPNSWFLVITDVIGSTTAIKAGRYKDVNAAGVSCIVAVKNVLGGLSFPYVFGGDGATFLVPEHALAKVAAALHGVGKATDLAFDLQLRLGAVPVAALREDGFEIKVARFRASTHATFAMFAGGGLSEAERRIKDPALGPRYALPASAELGVDLSGFECRWRPIPSQHGQVVSVLIQAQGSDAQNTATYTRVLAELDRLTHGLETTGPVSRAGLRLAFGGSANDQEARLFAGAKRGWPYWRARLYVLYKVLLGQLLLLTGRTLGGFNGNRYKDDLIDNSDFRKFDGTVRLVLDITPDQATALQSLLESEYQRGHLVYGLHTASASLMTCVISNYSHDHVHFIDGADGGYAMAAVQLKSQLKSRL
ncbi:MAG TPA: DUF3095 domain-containing protein [Polyangiaceae bacterium]|nr:DUF3095 domain-containing protein [Polyangiaceae bacterium]